MKRIILSFVVGLSLLLPSLGSAYNNMPEPLNTPSILEKYYVVLPEEGKEVVRRLCELDIQMFKKTSEVFQVLFESARVSDNAEKIINEYHAHIEEMNTWYFGEELALRNQFPKYYVDASDCAMKFRIAVMPCIGKMELALFEACKVLMNGHIRFPVSEITQDMIDHINKMKPAGFLAMDDVIKEYQDILDQLT